MAGTCRRPGCLFPIEYCGFRGAEKVTACRHHFYLEIQEPLPLEALSFVHSPEQVKIYKERWILRDEFSRKIDSEEGFIGKLREIVEEIEGNLEEIKEYMRVKLVHFGTLRSQLEDYMKDANVELNTQEIDRYLPSIDITAFQKVRNYLKSTVKTALNPVSPKWEPEEFVEENSHENPLNCVKSTENIIKIGRNEAILLVENLNFEDIFRYIEGKFQVGDWSSVESLCLSHLRHPSDRNTQAKLDFYLSHSLYHQSKPASARSIASKWSTTIDSPHPIAYLIQADTWRADIEENIEINIEKTEKEYRLGVMYNGNNGYLCVVGMTWLGCMYQYTGKYKEAEMQYLIACQVLGNQYKNTFHHALCRYNLAVVMMKMTGNSKKKEEKKRKARENCEMAVRIFRELGRESVEFADCLVTGSGFWEEEGKERKEALETARLIYEQMAPMSVNCADCWCQLGDLYKQLNQAEGAIRAYHKACDLYSTLPNSKEKHANCYFHIGEIYKKHLQNPVQALNYFKSALNLYETNSENLPKCLKSYGSLMKTMEKQTKIEGKASECQKTKVKEEDCS